MHTIINERFFREAAEIAKGSLCQRDRCGAVIILNNNIIGFGYNAPPNDDIKNRKCDCDFPANSPKPKSDRTCCIHAEIRAIDKAKENTQNLAGSIMYFTRIDDQDQILHSGDPYCTMCSRTALDNGISYWALWHPDGIKLYDAKTYNDLSYKFHEKSHK